MMALRVLPYRSLVHRVMCQGVPHLGFSNLHLGIPSICASSVGLWKHEVPYPSGILHGPACCAVMRSRRPRSPVLRSARNSEPFGLSKAAPAAIVSRPFGMIVYMQCNGTTPSR